jgi:hypothetical protein
MLPSATCNSPFPLSENREVLSRMIRLEIQDADHDSLSRRRGTHSAPLSPARLLALAAD